MTEYLMSLVARAGHWGYAVVFLVTAIECSAFLGVLVPGEMFVVFGGFLASRSVFDLDVFIMVAGAGAIVGDSLGYEMGRHLGRAWLLRFGRHVGIREEQLERADRFFVRHGGKAVFIGRFVGFLRAFAPFVAGSSRMPYTRFLFYNATGAFLWAAAFSTIGYLAGESWRAAEGWIGRASAILAGLIALVAVLAWLWRGAIRHEQGLRRAWKAFIRRPGIAAARERLEPWTPALQARLSPEGYLGLHLTIGLIVLVLACWWFGGIAEDIMSRDPLVFIDRSVALWLHGHATEGTTRAAQAITSLGSTRFLSGAGALIALIFIYRRMRYELLTLALTLGGGALLNLALKAAFQRPRPFFDHPLLTEHGYSFPSGHTMNAALLYGLLAVLIAKALPWRWGVLAVLAALGVIVLVGASRMYLGVHYLSDVMGAFAAALAWLALCVTGVETLRRYSRSGL